MSGLLPIVAGCTALIIKGRNLGMQVKVISYIGVVSGFKLTDNWEVATLTGPIPEEITHPMCSESYLMRIDGGHNEEEKQECKQLEKIQ